MYVMLIPCRLGSVGLVGWVFGFWRVLLSRDFGGCFFPVCWEGGREGGKGGGGFERNELSPASLPSRVCVCVCMRPFGGGAIFGLKG